MFFYTWLDNSLSSFAAPLMESSATTAAVQAMLSYCNQFDPINYGFSAADSITEMVTVAVQTDIVSIMDLEASHTHLTPKMCMKESYNICHASAECAGCSLQTLLGVEFGGHSIGDYVRNGYMGNKVDLAGYLLYANSLMYMLITRGRF